MQHNHIEASGEKGIWQLFIFLQIFSMHLINAFPSLSMMMTLLAISSVESPPVRALCNRSSSQCHTMLDSRLSMYVLVHPGSLLFSCLLAGLTIFTGSTPTNDSIGMSMMNVQWSPTPYPDGITHALLMSRSFDTHIPSIGLELIKNVAPRL